MATSQDVYSQDELERLHQLAVDFVKRDGEYTCDVFYRNKPREKDNKMKVYMKDDNGDPKSPINGRIKGLFFATHVDPRTGEPSKMVTFWIRESQHSSQNHDEKFKSLLC
ncbi:hypothetical protein NP493_276g03011 [Ridgeia piscesae]|uniref:Phytanoyl-CoA hydroxylase-interacting protein-like C-terminal domain-containing protein n=1 Tax=Ridgeia piscesae TaxID=27915 RepID=A0AAD9NXC9_RIDPI|nr:hypothetical protein NP493_276g03011 [Ridgeia piscesae]